MQMSSRRNPPPIPYSGAPRAPGEGGGNETGGEGWGGSGEAGGRGAGRQEQPRGGQEEDVG